LGRSSGSRKGLFRKGLRLGRFTPRPRPKPKVLQKPKGLLGATPTAVRGSFLRPEISTAEDYGVGQEVPSSGCESFPAVVPAMSPSPFVFPPSPALDLLPPASMDVAPIPVRSKVDSVHASLPYSSVGAGTGMAEFPSPSGAVVLGEKIRSFPVLQPSKPFQRYYRKARDLRVGHSVIWNEVLLADSLEASKTSVWKGSVTEPPVKKSAGSEKKSFLRKGFLNPPSRVVKDVGVGSLPSPPSCPQPVEGNGFSPSRNWPVGFDLNGELVAWEKDDDFWEGLPLDWEMDGVQDEESLAILDALEEDIHRDKMIARQKTKGKRELLNLKSSINYGDANTSSKRGKGKALMM